MPKVYVHNRISLDGFFAGPNGEMDWFIPDADIDSATHEIIDADTLLLGRITYKGLESFWPPIAADPNAPENMRAMADEVVQGSKTVFSRTLNEVTWENSTLMKGDLVDTVRRLKQDAGMLIIGSGSIVHQLTRAGLIDEYVLILTPVVLGSGKPMFPSDCHVNLTLVTAQSFGTGNVLLHYRHNV